MSDDRQIAIFGDIHANLPALEAVLGDMETRGLRDRYCLGDLVGYGAFPNEVIQIIRAFNIPTIKGNYDEGVGNNSDDCGCLYRTSEAEALGKRSIAWTNIHTTDENKTTLRNLPYHIVLDLGHYRVRLVHGSPRRINEYLYEDRPDSTFERLLDLIRADVMVCGHTHLPYHRRLPGDRHVINAGSVGRPKDHDPRACYAVLSAVNGNLDVQFIRVPYDVEKAAQAIEATNIPHAMPHEYADMLREGYG